jgi:lysophospholipase L1-like esterase
MEAAPPAEIRLLCLGDSYTIGEGVRPDEGWPARLAAMLRARGMTVAAPAIIARTGWTTDELARGIDGASPKGTYGVVTLLIGVNDQYRGRPPEEYRDQFRALLKRAIAFAGGVSARVIVLSIPDWSVTPFAAARDRAGIAAEIDAYNATNRQETALAGARYVDITPLSRRAADSSALVATDGLHPSAAMYEDWTRILLPVAEQTLAQRPSSRTS